MKLNNDNSLRTSVNKRYINIPTYMFECEYSYFHYSLSKYPDQKCEIITMYLYFANYNYVWAGSEEYTVSKILYDLIISSRNSKKYIIENIKYLSLFLSIDGEIKGNKDYFSVNFKKERAPYKQFPLPIFLSMLKHPFGKQYIGIYASLLCRCKLSPNILNCGINQIAVDTCLSSRTVITRIDEMQRFGYIRKLYQGFCYEGSGKTNLYRLNQIGDKYYNHIIKNTPLPCDHNALIESWTNLENILSYSEEKFPVSVNGKWAYDVWQSVKMSGEYNFYKFNNEYVSLICKSHTDKTKYDRASDSELLQSTTYSDPIPLIINCEIFPNSFLLKLTSLLDDYKHCKIILLFPEKWEDEESSHIEYRNSYSRILQYTFTNLQSPELDNINENSIV